MQYLLAHWRGELSLTKSTLLNGVVAYFVLMFLFLGAGQFIKSEVFVYFALAGFVGWIIWAAIGITRCAFKIIFSKQSTEVHRIAATAAVFCVIAFVIFVGQDLFYLFR